MDGLTSFLMDQHGAEMSLDALTDSMLANLPHEPGTFDAAAPIVPFNTAFSKSTGVARQLLAHKIFVTTPWHLDFWLLLRTLDLFMLIRSTLTCGGFCAGFSSLKQQQFSQQYQSPWDFSVPVPLAQASLPMDFGPEQTSSPLFAALEQPLFSSTTPSAVPAQPKKLQHTSSSCSSDSKEDQEISKLQERIQKQKEKNARNQREFRKRVRGRLPFNNSFC
jgi:hypothetical protein